MQWLRALIAGCKALRNPAGRAAEIDEELRAFVDASAEEKMRRGMSADEARRRARAEMGSRETVRQQMHGTRWESFAESAWQDLRYGVRQLLRSPGFFLVAVMMLALGIGANTAIFTLMHAVLFRTLPISEPGSLYRVGEGEFFCCEWGGLEGDWGTFDYPYYKHLRDTNPAFQQVAAFSGGTTAFNVRRAGKGTDAQTVSGEFVTGNFFRTLGVDAALGRMLGDGDDRRASQPAAVLSYTAWRDKFASDPSMVGTTVTVNGLPVTVVGVAKEGFFGDRLSVVPPELWLPIEHEPTFEGQGKASLLESSGDAWLYVIGRLRPGYQPRQVEAGLSADIRQWLRSQRKLGPEDLASIAKQYVRLTPGGAGISPLRSSAKNGLYLLSAASLLVLLIACGNLANLMLARGAARQQQTSLRLSLGASRARLLRTALTESLLVSFLGGVAGLGLAYAGTRAILLIAFRGATHVPVDARPSLPVLGCALLLSLFTGVVFGLIPAWIATGSQPTDGLRESGRSTTSRTNGPQRVLVAVQAALSVVLLAVAGLVVQSLRNLEGAPTGFETRGRLVADLSFKAAGYQPAQLAAVYEELQQRLEAIPGVHSASLSLHSPQHLCCINLSVFIAGRREKWIEDTNVIMTRVTPHYFETIGTPLLRGRAFTAGDTQGATHVAVVDAAFAQKFFAGGEAIGQHFGLSLEGHGYDYEIIGVVGSARYKSPSSEQSPAYFLPFTQTTSFQPDGYQRLETSTLYAQSIELSVTGSPKEYENLLRKTVASVDQNLSLIHVDSYEEAVAIQFNQQRLIARLTGLYSVLALLLASVGLYGVTAYGVARRTGEIGVRLALGASRGNVMHLVLRGALTHVGAGLAVGVPVAIVTGAALAHQLYGVPRFDLRVLAGAVLVLLGCALIAGFLPARRAARIEPMEALRTE